MKKIIYFCICIVIGIDMMAQSNVNNRDGDEGPFCEMLEKFLNFEYSNQQVPVAAGWIYDSIYSDEFEGNSLDKTKWWRWNETYHENNYALGYMKRNVTVSNGKLVLSAKYEPDGIWVTHNGSSHYVHYSTGGVQSNRKIKYGYFEVECYLPKNNKFRPCFWPWDRTEDNYNEIDVFEITDNDNSPYIIQQNAYTNLDMPDVSRTRQHLTISDSITGKTTRFGVEVLPYEIVFYINGRVSSHLVYKYEKANSVNIYTCSNIMRMIPMYITMTFIVNVDNGMPQPYEDFTVNYFRCYKMARGNQNTYHPLVFTPSAESCKVYPNVILGGDGYTATVNTSTAVWAEQTIILDKGFEIPAGVTFSARRIKHGWDNAATSPLYIGNYTH